MHSLETQIENTYERQTSLLGDLRDCLEMERESLMEVDVDRLWELMEKKNALAMDVERTGNEIKCLMAAGFPDSTENPRSSALKEWPWYKALHSKTTLLKEEIRVRIEENQVFIKDSLGFFDELMNIIVQSGGKGDDYQHLQSPQEKHVARIYHREV
ncbi:MAG: flagellar protein FlgN [Desulfatiglandaceae bacterium]|jgi:hypothetical protein